MGDDDHSQKKVKCSWFVGVEKRAVLAEVIMCFGDPRIRDTRRCLQVMRKLLYLLNQGQTFTKSEAATILFSASKLFRLLDSHLRRLVYLLAEELCPIAEEGHMLESALLQDLAMSYRHNTSRRPNAIRLLCRNTNFPSSISTYIEEFLKEAIECPNIEISSAGLVCVHHLLKKNQRIGIKVCEHVGTVAAESYGHQRFHALCLLSRMQEIETLGFRELARPHIDKILLCDLKKEDIYDSHPLFTCLAIRLITINGANKDYWKYMNWCFNLWGYHGHRLGLGNEMVAVEILYSVMQLRNISGSKKEAVIEAVRRRLSNSHDQKTSPVFFDVHRSMLKWSRIQNHPQADADVAQVAESKTQVPAPAPATDTLNLRKRRTELQY